MLSVPWIGCGIANCVILTFRVTPLSAIDLQIMKLSLVLMYLSPVQRIFLYCAVGICVAGIIFLWIVGPKISGKIHYGKNVASIAGLLICVLAITNVAQSIEAVSRDFGNLAGAYNDYGFVYCFSSSVLDTGIDQPEGYDENNIKSIVSSLPETKNTESLQKPDVILIQLESFVDPKLIKEITFSDDPAPIHTLLREKFSHGNLSVPSFGGGTANTEFEILTGINLDYFGPGEYPYKTVLLEETCESIAYNLKEVGYSAHAIHNHTGSFYDRDKVYPNLGFDSFQSKEYMYDYETTPYGWCKDKALTEEILTALTYTDAENEIEEGTPRFVWAVSVQGHGKYPSEPISDSSGVIKIKGDSFSAEELCALEYYVNQVWEMDMFLGSLISALENSKRPTLVVAYGDHLPAIGLDGEDYALENVYTTEYVTWNNFGLEKTVKDLRTDELSSEIMSWLGFNNGNITKLHQNSLEDSDAEDTCQEKVGFLAYDMLYGSSFQFDGVKPFEKTNMRMGTIPITAENIQLIGDTLYVQGSGFTEKSVVFINGQKQETVMLSQYSLMASDVSIFDGDAVVVGQSSGKKDVLGYSNPIMYDRETDYYSDNK